MSAHDLPKPPASGGVQRCGARRGDESTVRRTTVDGVVDTGAVMLLLPENTASRLGLRTLRKVAVTCADERGALSRGGRGACPSHRKETRQVAGPVTVQVVNRFMTTACIVGPPSSEPLIGRIVNEGLDLVADCANQTLASRPESPDLPLLKLK